MKKKMMILAGCLCIAAVCVVRFRTLDAVYFEYADYKEAVADASTGADFRSALDPASADDLFDWMDNHGKDFKTDMDLVLELYKGNDDDSAYALIEVLKKTVYNDKHAEASNKGIEFFAELLRDKGEMAREIVESADEENIGTPELRKKFRLALGLPAPEPLVDDKSMDNFAKALTSIR